MPLCMILIALMYFILREPCPCDEEDKVVEGLDWWWWVLIGWLGIGLVFGVLVVVERDVKTYIKASKFKSLYVFFTVFTGAFGYLYLNKFLIGDIGKVVEDSAAAAKVTSEEAEAVAQEEAEAQAKTLEGAEKRAYFMDNNLNESIEGKWVKDPKMEKGGRWVGFGKGANLDATLK